MPISKDQTNYGLFLQYKHPHHMCRLAKAASSGVQMLSPPAAPTSGAVAAPASVFVCAGAASCRAFLSAHGNILIICRSRKALYSSQVGSQVPVPLQNNVGEWQLPAPHRLAACGLSAGTSPHRASSQRRSAGRKNRAASGEGASRQRISTPSATAGALSTCSRQPQNNHKPHDTAMLVIAVQATARSQRKRTLT